MLAARWLARSLARRGSSQRDERSVKTVIDLASERLDEPRQDAVVRELEDNGVRWAWQLGEASDLDWEKLKMSLGMKLAVKAELNNPTALSLAVCSSTTTFKDDDIDDRMRRFLLMPTADGKEPQKLGEVSALFLGLLVAPAAERQQSLLAVCELMALICGLILPLPLEMRRHSSAAAHSDAKGWDVLPTLADGMDAMAGFITLVDAIVAFMAVCMALFIASGGYHADRHFCEGAMSVVTAFFLVFMFCVITPAMCLFVWGLFTDAASPYPMIAGLVLMLLAQTYLGSVMFKFIFKDFALEIYHSPRWAMWMYKVSYPEHKNLLVDATLRAAAEKRADKLRARAGITAVDVEVAPAASPFGDARPQAGQVTV